MALRPAPSAPRAIETIHSPEPPMSRSLARRPLAIIVLGAAAIVAACSPATPTAAPSAATPAQSAPVAVQLLPAEVSTADALALREAGAFILDVRQPDEWAAVHIPGATLIPLGDLPSRVAEVPKDRQVVVVCHSGNRSAKGRDVLLGAGYPSVTSMAGGMTAWTAAGYPTESGS
jgi:rhodanese-related sulfurtransferase